MTARTYTYVSNPEGARHLVPSNRIFAVAPRTLCGAMVLPGWSDGDETQSGIAATCGTCRRSAERNAAVAK